ncbi:MAG: AbrB/MazE/SpoVT family DNA-binding domain-containing protein [Proteobacteria bacterium]|nr:AbrB/MazE/SpoVT family DNA-binding domain-containing protein [Pseudomonadota bacterium]
MQQVSTAKLSSKGQIVIPEPIRRRLGLVSGDQFVVVGEGDVVILKSIRAPSLAQLEGLLKEVRGQARKAGLTRADLGPAVARARRRR